MQMKKICVRTMSILTAAAVLSGGCSAWEGPSGGRLDVNPEPAVSPEPPAFEADPASFSLTVFTDEGEAVPVSLGAGEFEAADYEEGDGTVSWRYPGEGIVVEISGQDGFLQVDITAEGDGDQSFAWPVVAAERYYIPFGEGKRIPAADEVWKEYLGGEEFTVLEELSMPFWSAVYGDSAVVCVMEDPLRTSMDFSDSGDVGFTVHHEYAAISGDRTSTFRIYLTDADPVSAAKRYRDFVEESGRFKTLEQKAEENPAVRKLYGAPFVYLAGEMFLLGPEDIEWQAFRLETDSPVMKYLLSFSAEIENGGEFEAVMEALRGQDYVDAYQKHVICRYVSDLLARENFWSGPFFFPQAQALGDMLGDGYETLDEAEKIAVNKQALALSLPDVFSDPEGWRDGDTTGLIAKMKDSGIDRAWVAVHGWEDAYGKPELIRAAVDAGYLAASYDSYHSIHEPGAVQWTTAGFEDPSLYETATVTGKDGEKISGYKGVGRKLNAVLAFPAVQARMEKIMANDIPFNSWFIDCDAYGEVYDDYSEGHVTPMEEDLAARLKRMGYIRDEYGLVVGSEGGNDYAASEIAFAHGIELKSFSWTDGDMKDKESEYYIGKYYSAEGGVTENFAKRIPVKEKYYDVFVNPRYDVPLYKLVYNDSVITSYHWDWSVFKIQGATGDRMIREILYNVPPLYHLDAEEWEKYKEEIIAHHQVWSPFSRLAVTREMTDFEYLTEDGAVQKTVYGEDLAAVANFSDQAFVYQNTEIPPHSVWMNEEGRPLVYTPVLGEDAR